MKKIIILLIILMTGVLFHCDSNSSNSQNPASDTIPDVPDNLRQVTIGTDYVEINWDDNSDNEDNFILERSLNGTDFTELVQPVSDSFSYKDEGLTAATHYWYRIA